MIEHIGIYVNSLEESHKLYKPLLATLGIDVIFQTEHCIAYGKNKKPSFEIYFGKPASSPLHIAFAGNSKEEVDAFYHTAIKLGFKDNGAPGYRTYFPGYYAAFVLDPNGHNIECLFWDETRQ